MRHCNNGRLWQEATRALSLREKQNRLSCESCLRRERCCSASEALAAERHVNNISLNIRESSMRKKPGEAHPFFEIFWPIICWWFLVRKSKNTCWCSSNVVFRLSVRIKLNDRPLLAGCALESGYTVPWWKEGRQHLQLLREPRVPASQPVQSDKTWEFSQRHNTPHLIFSQQPNSGFFVLFT